jgi:glycerate dehydrogenase
VPISVNIPRLLVTLDADPRSRAIIERGIGSAGEVAYLTGTPAERASALAEADVLLARNTAKELRPGEAGQLRKARLVQFVTAGVDYIPLGDLPTQILVASNGGAYAEPMAEHALSMTLAALKRLFVEHAKLAAGHFDQFRQKPKLRGATVGIHAFVGIGVATARAMRALGAKVHAINRSGTTDEPVDWIGTGSRLDQLLATADVLVLSLPLTPATEKLIGTRELRLMKRDAVLVNLARGEVIDEAALYAHLLAEPAFTACLDAWWVEPVRHGHFAMGHPFTRLPNVIASPHNSASASGWRDVALARAVENARRALVGDTPWHLGPPADRMR